MNRKAMHSLTYGLFVLTAKQGDKQNGCIINTALQVTTDPNRIAITVNKANYTHDMLMETDDFTVSVISESADFELFKHFGFQSGKEADKFEGFGDVKEAINGTLIITKGTNAYISGKIFERIDLGSHTMFIADVTDADVLSDEKSASYEFYQENIKPKRKAPEAGKEEGKVVWVCKICGYEYEGEVLPDDFICPVCKHPASDFEKVVK